MKFLLDTNVCIAIINGNPGVVRERVQKELRAGTEIHYRASPSLSCGTAFPKAETFPGTHGSCSPSWLAL
jgi:hypothetical protein